MCCSKADADSTHSLCSPFSLSTEPDSSTTMTTHHGICVFSEGAFHFEQ